MVRKKKTKAQTEGEKLVESPTPNVVAKDGAAPAPAKKKKLVARKESSLGGHGLFANKNFTEGDVCVKLRPACSVIFDQYSKDVCAWCFKTDKKKEVEITHKVLRAENGGFGIRLSETSPVRILGFVEDFYNTNGRQGTKENNWADFLSVGDKVTEVNGVKVKDLTELVPALKSTPEGKPAEIKATREWNGLNDLDVIAGNNDGNIHVVGLNDSICAECIGNPFVQKVQARSNELFAACVKKSPKLEDQINGRKKSGDTSVLRFLIRYQAGLDVGEMAKKDKSVPQDSDREATALIKTLQSFTEEEFEAAMTGGGEEKIKTSVRCCLRI